MLSDDTLPQFMKRSLDDAYKRMEHVKNQHQFNQLIRDAPAFKFTKVNDYTQAVKADNIVILVAPDKYYEFEVLCHDPERNRIVINAMEFKRITEEKYAELIMDHYPMLATI